MSHLPSGTVSFLFTDIEKSTRKWQNWPYKMKNALKKHDDLFARIIADHSGYVFKTVGDAFCVAFESPMNAVTCSVALQLGLSAEEWELPEEFRVRMAIHTGEAEERNGDYYGPALNRVARLEAITWGGQILISFVTAELIRDMLPGELELVPMGEHRLKDLIRPEKVFQVSHSRLPDDFEPLPSLDTRRHNLAIQPSVLIGRDEELEAIKHALYQKSSRLVTITGPGGMGKTRIAVQTGAEAIENFRGGVFFIDLTLIREDWEFYPLISSTLDVKQTSESELFQELVDFLSDREILLILDNFEHLIGSAYRLAELMAHCSRLKCLVTSREPLHLRGEHLYHLPPLSVPENETAQPARKLNQYNAVRLFIERAVEVKEDFSIDNSNAPVIAQICYELDGIPLAIELAAARITTLDPRSLLKRLNHSLDLLTMGAVDLPDRHRTLRSTIDWSFELLGDREKELFLALSLFRGGFDLEAAEAVCFSLGGTVLDGLEHLVEKNLLVRKDLPDGEPWFYMLETIHEFALDLIEEKGELESGIRERFLDYFLLFCSRSCDGLSGPDQKICLDRLSGHRDSLFFLLDGLIGEEKWEPLVSLVGALWPYWEIAGLFREGIRYSRTVYDQTGDLLCGIGLGALLLGLGKYGESRDFLMSLGGESRLLLYYRAWASFRCGNLSDADRDFSSSEQISGSENDRRMEAKTIMGMAMVDWKKGEPDKALALLSRALTMLKYCGDPRTIGQAANNMGILYFQKGENRKAEKYFKDALPIFRAISNRSEIRILLNNLGYLDYTLENYSLSLRYYRELEKISSDDDFFLGTAYLGMASSEIRLDRLGPARRKCDRALEILDDRTYPGDHGIAWRIMGDLNRAEGNSGEARRCYEKAIPLLRDNGEDDDLEMAEKSIGELR
jgi:predicted ATPase/class 3 adenylate cyclase/predicted negative regulator of RcsB-dependent stress response